MCVCVYDKYSLSHKIVWGKVYEILYFIILYYVILYYIFKHLDSNTRNCAILKESTHQTGETICAYINTKEKLLTL